MERRLRDLTEYYFTKSVCNPDKYIDVYINELLPLEIDYFKSKKVFSEVIDTDILVQLVGFSWEPLFISLCAYQPETLVLVLNKKYNEQLGDRRGIDYEEHINKLTKASLITDKPEIVSETVED